MGSNPRFHQSTTYYLEHVSSLLNNGIESGRINENDRLLIEEYISEITAISQISPSRRYKLVGILIRNREYHPPYSECQISDVYSALDRIKNSTNPDGSPRYTKNTISDLVQVLKRFFLWMAENEHTDISVSKLRKIKVPKFDRNTVTAEMILTEEEMKAIIDAATTSRDRALLSVLYEGGFRIGEIANMRWCDVKFTDWCVTVNTAEKTGKARYVSLTASRALLSQWKNDYPLPITDDSFVFLTTTTKQPLQYNGLVKQIRIIATRAGIKKHIKPHIFRHSRITHLIQQGMNESIVKLMMWGDVNTNMMAVYQHLTNEDIDKEVAKLNGVVRPEGEQKSKGKRVMKPIQCMRCATVNHPSMKYCGNCGAPLDESEIATTESMENDLLRSMMDNPSFMMDVYKTMQDLANKHNVSLSGGDEKGL